MVITHKILIFVPSLKLLSCKCLRLPRPSTQIVLEFRDLRVTLHCISASTSSVIIRWHEGERCHLWEGPIEFDSLLTTERSEVVKKKIKINPYSRALKLLNTMYGKCQIVSLGAKEASSPESMWKHILGLTGTEWALGDTMQKAIQHEKFH